MKRALARKILSESRKKHLTSSAIETIILCLLRIRVEDVDIELKDSLACQSKIILGMARNQTLTEKEVTRILNNFIEKYPG